MDFWIGLALDVLTAIAVVLLSAIGLYVIYGLMRVINMAHGDMMMVGAYCTAASLQVTGSFWLGLLFASLVVGMLGFFIERLILRRLYGRGNLATLLATWGVGLVIVEVVRLWVGPSGWFVDAPLDRVISIYNTPYPLYSSFLVLCALALLTLMWLLLTRSTLGIVIRATMEDPARAEAMGINTDAVYRWSFVSGSLLAGIAGGLLAPISAVTPYMGSDSATRAFLVVIVGGFGSLLSPITGSTLVGGARALLSSFLGVTTATIGMFSIVLITLLVKPLGITVKGRPDEF